MASAAKDEAFKKVDAEIRDDDRPKVSDEELKELRKDNRESVRNVKRTADGTTEGGQKA